MLEYIIVFYSILYSTLVTIVLYSILFEVDAVVATLWGSAGREGGQRWWEKDQKGRGNLITNYDYYYHYYHYYYYYALGRGSEPFSCSSFSNSNLELKRADEKFRASGKSFSTSTTRSRCHSLSLTFRLPRFPGSRSASHLVGHGSGACLPLPLALIINIIYYSNTDNTNNDNTHSSNHRYLIVATY